LKETLSAIFTIVELHLAVTGDDMGFCPTLSDECLLALWTLISGFAIHPLI